MAFRKERLLEEQQRVLERAYAALRAGEQEEAEEWRERHRCIELELDQLLREEHRAKAIIRAKERSRAQAAAGGGHGGCQDPGALVVAVPETRADLCKRMQSLQIQLEQARARDDTDAAIAARKAMQRLEGVLEQQQSCRSAGRAAPALADCPERQRAAATGRSRAAQQRSTRILSMVPESFRMAGNASGGGSFALGVQRFFAMEAELEQALDDQDWEAAVELRRRLVVFGEEREFQELAAAAQPRGRKLQALKAELEKALDASEPAAVWEAWRRMKVAHAFQQSAQSDVQAASEASSSRASAGKAAGRGRAGCKGGGKAAGEPLTKSSPLVLPERRAEAKAGYPPKSAEPSEAATEDSTAASMTEAAAQSWATAGDDTLLARRRAQAQAHVESLTEELAMVGWSLSASPEEEDEGDGERRNLLERRTDLESQIRELERAVRLPNPCAASALFREVVMRAT